MSSPRTTLIALAASCWLSATGCGSNGSDPPLPDAGPAADAPVDAQSGSDATATCEVGRAVNTDAVEDVNFFGEVAYFAGGRIIAPGTYQVRYIDGCIKYAASQWWAIHANSEGTNSWWMVGVTSADQLFLLPGTVGFLPGTGNGDPTTGDVQGDRNGFERFEDCVSANAALPAMTFEHTGGPLGIHLVDAPYADNVAGEGGRNPTWALAALGPCSAAD